MVGTPGSPPRSRGNSSDAGDRFGELHVNSSGAGLPIGGASSSSSAARARSRSSSGGAAGDLAGSLPLSSPRRRPQPVPDFEATEFRLATSTDGRDPPPLSLGGPAAASGGGSGAGSSTQGASAGGAAAAAGSPYVAQSVGGDGLGSLASFPSAEGRRARPHATSTSDFQLLCVIGMGAFGRVLQVRNRVDAKVYAMKVISKKVLRRKNSVENMRAEQDILTKIKHPFIMQLQCSFSSADKLFLVMDYMHGGELFFHLRKAGLLLDATARFYVGEILLALEHLHHKGIIHRDLKPENVSKKRLRATRAAVFALCARCRNVLPFLKIFLKSGRGGRGGMGCVDVFAKCASNQLCVCVFIVFLLCVLSGFMIAW